MRESPIAIPMNRKANALVRSLKFTFMQRSSGLQSDTCSEHEERPLAMRTGRIFNSLRPHVANMHLYFPCSLQVRRDLLATRRYARPSALRGPLSSSDRE